MKAKFDEIDRMILETLQKDGRITMKKLGEIVHLSSPAVTERVLKMESMGIIESYKAQVNPRALGYDVEGWMVVTVNESKRDALLTFVQETEEILRADEVPGESEIMLHFVCENYADYLELLRRLKEFGTTESYMYMGSFKDEVLLPIV